MKVVRLTGVFFDQNHVLSCKMQPHGPKAASCAPTTQMIVPVCSERDLIYKLKEQLTSILSTIEPCMYLCRNLAPSKVMPLGDGNVDVLDAHSLVRLVRYCAR